MRESSRARSAHATPVYGAPAVDAPGWQSDNHQVDPESVLQSLRSLADRNVFDVSMANMQRLAMGIGVDRAPALSKTGCYEARSVAELNDDPVNTCRMRLRRFSSGQNSDAEFAKRPPFIGNAATDDRNFVMKGVRWALRASVSIHPIASPRRKTNPPVGSERTPCAISN